MSAEDLAAELCRFGRELAEEGAIQVGPAFTDVPEADALVKRRPEAFLLGLLFTQGIPAERAWAAPWLLMHRLGHLDVARLAAEPEAVRAAVQRPPMLHRFKETVPRWIVAAARRLMEEYGGQAARIWARGSSVLQVAERLEEFEGIGRKKAVLGAEMLVRCLGVPLTGLEEGQVAFDVHVRRVFLRSGLVERDAREDVAAAARLASPAEPGLVDLPAWIVGREWCRPREPRCGPCRLSRACPRRIWLDAEGVGGRGRKPADDRRGKRGSS